MDLVVKSLCLESYQNFGSMAEGSQLRCRVLQGFDQLEVVVGNIIVVGLGTSHRQTEKRTANPVRQGTAVFQTRKDTLRRNAFQWS